MVGNKGGVAISLNVDDVSVCFVTAHLAAHQDKTLKRNEDVAAIVSGLSLNATNVDPLQAFDYVFFCGDLNYRVDYAGQGANHSPTSEQFSQYLSKIHIEGTDQVDVNGLKELAANDQLTSEMSNGSVFHGYTEGPFWNFRPTFKVQRHTKTIQYKDQRSPAWCDRVLVRTQPAMKLLPNPTLVKYDSVEDINTSDHKPVYAVYTLPLIRLPCATDFQRGMLQVIFNSVSICDLRPYDRSGKASPLLKFHSPHLLKSLETNHIKDVLTCSWNAGDIPKLTMMVNSVERLQYAPLLIKVLNYAYETKIQRFIASALIDLTTALSASNYTSEFSQDLYFGGLPAGKISGSFTLNWLPSPFQLNKDIQIEFQQMKL